MAAVTAESLAALKESDGLVEAMRVALEADDRLSYANYHALPPHERAEALAARTFTSQHWDEYQALLREQQDTTS